MPDSVTQSSEPKISPWPQLQEWDLQPMQGGDSHQHSAPFGLLAVPHTWAERPGEGEERTTLNICAN